MTRPALASLLALLACCGVPPAPVRPDPKAEQHANVIGDPALGPPGGDANPPRARLRAAVAVPARALPRLTRPLVLLKVDAELGQGLAPEQAAEALAQGGADRPPGLARCPVDLAAGLRRPRLLNRTRGPLTT